MALRLSSFPSLFLKFRSFCSRPSMGQSSSLMDIGCREIFSSDHDILRESVRRFIKDNIVPFHHEWEKAGQVDRQLWYKAGEQGLLGISIPEEDGGHGGDILGAAIVWEELGYANCSGPGFALHSDIVMPYLSHYGNKEQKEKYIPKMKSGEIIGAIGFTEPGAGR